MKKKRKLEQELKERKNAIGLVGTALEVSEVPGKDFSAHITLDFKTIYLNYGLELVLVPDRETENFIKKKNITNPEKKLGEDILEHEAGHRENPTETRYGCPYTVEIHDRIKNSIAKALQLKGKTGLEDYVTNAFEDVLNNINCRRKTDFAGQTLFWNTQGLLSKNQKFSPFYEAFVKVNCILGRNIQDTTLLRRFYTNNEKVQKAVKSFTDFLKQQSQTSSIIKLHTMPAFQKLFNYDLEKRTALWETLAYQFVMATADLLEKMPQEQMFGISENEFDKQMENPKTRQEIVYGRYRQGKPLSVYRDTQEQLYDLYKRLSREINIETSYYKEAAQMPLIFYGKRFVREDERKLKFKGIGFDEQGKLKVKTSKHAIHYPVSYKTHPRNFPKLKITLMDRSGSMSLNPDNETDGEGNPKNIGNTDCIPWGDKSKYHYALKGYFGIDNFISAQGISPYVESCAIGFSGEEIIRGNTETVAKSLLVNPSGGTSFDIDGLEKQLEQEALVLSISDGDFSLTEELKEKIKGKITQCDYAHIQIGQENSYTQFLRELQVPVFTVRGDNDLSQLMITFISKYYRSQHQTTTK